MMLDRDLDDTVFPADQFCHDWMHAIFVQGCFNTVLYLTLRDIKDSGITDIYSRLHAYIAMWTLPRRLGSAKALSQIFSPKRESSDERAKTFKCQASDGLSAISIIAIYFELVIMAAGFSMLACAAFLALADLVDLLMSVSTGLVSADALRDAVKHFLDACIAAGWRKFMHPKFHWLVHLARYLRKWGMLLSCFVHERKHRMVKRYSSDVFNTRRNEWSVLSEVTCHHIAALRETNVFNFGVGLIPPIQPAPPNMRDFLDATFGDLADGGLALNYTTAHGARVNEFHVCHTRDVVLVTCSDGHTRAAEVWFHAAVQDEPCSLVSIWDHIADLGVTARSWREGADNKLVIPSADILAPCSYKRDAADGSVMTLVPCIYR